MRGTAKEKSEAPYISFVPSALISARNQGLAVEVIAEFILNHISFERFLVSLKPFFLFGVVMCNTLYAIKRFKKS
jgi:hypothetical protein